jgi:hypothetical protein
MRGISKKCVNDMLSESDKLWLPFVSLLNTSWEQAVSH